MRKERPWTENNIYQAPIGSESGDNTDLTVESGSFHLRSEAGVDDNARDVKYF